MPWLKKAMERGTETIVIRRVTIVAMSQYQRTRLKGWRTNRAAAGGSARVEADAEPGSGPGSARAVLKKPFPRVTCGDDADLKMEGLPLLCVSRRSGDMLAHCCGTCGRESSSRFWLASWWPPLSADSLGLFFVKEGGKCECVRE